MTLQSHIASGSDHSIAAAQIVEPDGSPTWITRGSNFVVAVTRVATGSKLRAEMVVDEHIVLLPNTGILFRNEDQTATAIPGYHLVIVPPGSSELTCEEPGLVVRCFSSRMTSLTALAANAADFREPHKGVAPITDWPAPLKGYAVRVYDLKEALKSDDKSRCYRTSNLMVNVLREREQARDVSQLSPHAHNDFEQGSIAISGNYVHHLRVPWGPDLREWQADEAVEVGSPSVLVIPPKVVHTSRNVGGDSALLVDLFCPPRVDFSLVLGKVWNAEEYPLPDHIYGGSLQET